MGRVFSYDQISAGKVPSLGDFDVARDVFFEQVREGVADGHFDGGMIFGSTARGTQNVRSDFDTIVTLTDGSFESYRAARHLTEVVDSATDGRVPAEPAVYPRRALETGNHEIDQMFGKHLVSGLCLTEGEDLAKYITIPNVPAHIEFQDYLMAKSRKFSDSYVKGDLLALRDNRMQRILELANAVGRKLLNAMDYLGMIDDAAEGSEKLAIREQCEEIFEVKGLAGGFRTILALDRFYSDLLNDTMAGDVRRSHYDDGLKRIDNHVPMAIDWVREVALAYTPILRVHEES